MNNKLINGGHDLEPILNIKLAITKKNPSNFKLIESNVLENT